MPAERPDFEIKTDPFALGEECFNEYDALNKIQSVHGVMPPQRTKALINGAHRLVDLLPEGGNPRTMDELFQEELRRRGVFLATTLDSRLSAKSMSLDDTTNVLGIDKADIEQLRPWLDENREGALVALESLSVDELELPLALDQPDIRDESLRMTAEAISHYQGALADLFGNLTGVGHFIENIKAVPTMESRSYFNLYTRRLALALPTICYQSPGGQIHLRNKELIRLFGHEGMGHALNHLLTDGSDLPFFLKKGGDATIASQESATQFYERRIFIDLERSPETLEKLGVTEEYPALYQQEKDTAIINEYIKRTFSYGITVLADKSLGDPNDPDSMRVRTERLTEVALDPNFAVNFVAQNRYSYDQKGNLNYGLLSELRYCAQPVNNSLSQLRASGIEYDSDRRTEIDQAFLLGCWTPIGFEQFVNLRMSDK